MPTLIYRKDGRPNAHVFGAHESPIIVGRGLDCAIVVPDGDVSRKHAEIFTLDSGVTWYVRDLQSANGCFVNGQRVEKSRLTDGDTLSCGHLDFEFRRGPDTNHVAMMRKNVFFRNERITPVRSSGVIGDSFRVHEPVADSQHITSEIEASLKSSTHGRRIRELEEQQRATERENLRLRTALHTLIKLTGVDLDDVQTRIDRDVETFRQELLTSVGALPPAAIAAVAQVIRAERQIGIERSANHPTYIIRRERAATEDSD